MGPLGSCLPPTPANRGGSPLGADGNAVLAAPLKPPSSSLHFETHHHAACGSDDHAYGPSDEDFHSTRPMKGNFRMAERNVKWHKVAGAITFACWRDCADSKSLRPS